MKRSLLTCLEIANGLILWLPNIFGLGYIKAIYFRSLGSKVGSNVIFQPRVHVFPGRSISLGSKVNIARGVSIYDVGGLSIGSRVHIGFGATIITGNHIIPPLPGSIYDSGYERKPVLIGDDVWIGANVIILPGVTIGSGAVIAAGAVVTHNVESNKIAGGIPAKVIRSRT